MTDHYELLYVVSIKHTGDELNSVMESVTSQIIDKKGEITLNQIFGKQRLAFPIKKVTQGTYVVVEFDMPTENLKELDKQLTLINEVLRFLVVKKKVKTTEELEREQKIQDKILKGKEEELAALDKTAVKEQPVVEKVDQPVVAEVLPQSVELKPEVEKSVVEDLAVEPADEKVEPKKQQEAKPIEKTKSEEPLIIKEKKEKGKISLDDLDKKLDEILTDDIL